MRIASFPKIIVMFLSLGVLAGCSKGLDKALVTDKGADIYQVSLNEALRDMDQRSTEAFNWAVSDLTIETLNARYPNQSSRKVIRGEVGKVLAEFPASIAENEVKFTAWSSAATSVRKVVAVETGFSLESSFHGLQPTIRATIQNTSPHNYSSLRWYAELYLDDSVTPAASHILFDSYKRAGGLAAGASATRQFTVGFVTGDDAWTTLEIQNAKKRVVKLLVLPEFAKNYAEKLIVGDSPEAALVQLKQALQAAQELKDI
jgi:hypothetical protein